MFIVPTGANCKRLVLSSACHTLLKSVSVGCPARVKRQLMAVTSVRFSLGALKASWPGRRLRDGEYVCGAMSTSHTTSHARFYHTTFALLIHSYASWMPLDPQHLMLPIQWLRKSAFCHNNHILGPYLARVVVVGFL